MSAAGAYYSRRVRGLSIPALSDVADETVELCAATEVPAVQPYYWRKHEPRIQGARTHPRDLVIREDLNRQIIRMDPVRVHTIRDAVLIDGSVYLKRKRRIDLRSILKIRPPSVLPRGPHADLDRAALASSCAATTWFGHWLEDEIPRQLLSQSYADAMCHNGVSYSHESRYRQLLGLPLRWRLGSATIKELVVVEEFAQNPHKTCRYHEIRRRVARQFLTNSASERVFLLRGQSGVSRPLVNEEDLAAKFEADGYRCIDVAKTSLDELLAVCVGASVVISVEGSQLAHCLYAMRAGGTMIILNPPWRVHTTVADIGVFCGLHSAMFICEPCEKTANGFWADPSELSQFIEDALADAKNREQQLAEYVNCIVSRVPMFDSLVSR